MPYNKKPKMILFDVGGTLFDDGRCIPAEGLSHLRLAADNPEVTDDKTLAGLWEKAMNELDVPRLSRSGYELDIPLSCVLKFVAMQAGLKFSISAAHREEIFDRFNSTRELTPGISELLSRLDAAKIRTAVISNNMMSGEGLALSVSRWIPESKMEFCLTSADLLFSKPCPDLFLAAAGFAGLAPADCWYCGDGRVPDVEGAFAGGMTPVLYSPDAARPFEMRSDAGKGEYLAVSSWSVLGDMISEL